MAFDREVDVLIVGGGPAGLVAAETVASGGLSTLLVEQEKEIGQPVHTSGATTVQTVKTFRIPEKFYHSVTGITLYSPNDDATFYYNEPIGCILDVRGTYQYLAQKALNKGALILTNTKANEAILDNGFTVGASIMRDSSEHFKIRSKIMIDASGYRAAMSKQSGLHRGFTRFGVGAEYELLAPDCNQNEIALIVGSRYAPSGYAWIFPWGENRVRVGIGILHPDVSIAPKEYLETFVRKIGIFGVNQVTSKIREYHFGLIPSDGIASRFVGNGIMAIGDAAGQASLIAGEGIRLSMQAGQLAGKTAVEAISRGRWDAGSLMPYETAFRTNYGRNLAIGHIINKEIAVWNDDQWDKCIRKLKTLPPPFIPRLLVSEFSTVDLASLIMRRPNLWPLLISHGTKALLRYVSKSKQ